MRSRDTAGCVLSRGLTWVAEWMVARRSMWVPLGHVVLGVYAGEIGTVVCLLLQTESHTSPNCERDTTGERAEGEKGARTEVRDGHI